MALHYMPKANRRYTPKLKNSHAFHTWLVRIKCMVGLVVWLPRSRWAKRLVYGSIGVVAVSVCIMYGIAQWYIRSEAGRPLQLGVSFIPDYARSLGVDPPRTMDALLDIGVKQFRLVSYWSDVEPVPGQYDFSELDWQFKAAEARHAKIILTLGLRQPRWPECHMPDWAAREPESQWRPELEAYIGRVIERYKDSPSLQSYQLENEFFLKGFGICDQIPGAESRDRLISEYRLVKKADGKHPVIIGRSNNALGFPVGQPQPDEFSISIYKRTWDQTLHTHRYLEYPFPAWFYGFLAGTQKIFNHRNMMIGELQAEAWPPANRPIQETDLAEQNKSLNAERLADRFQYGRATGMRQIELWGSEYWYYRLTVLHDPSLWNVAKQEFNN